MRSNLGTTQRAALAVGSAATLALLGLATPAQAAPHDAAGHGRSASTGSEHRSTSLKDGRGHSSSWQAQSDPDGDENGGVDQPGGTGGTVGQQDGNNGSGNDADCEDDNRGKGVPGHCKDKPSKPGKGDEGSGGGYPGSEDSEGDQGSGSGHPGSSEEAPGHEQGDGGTTDAGTRPGSSTMTQPVVLGVEQLAPASRNTSRAAAPAADAPQQGKASLAARATDAVLPNTGAEAANLALFAGGLASVVAGTVLLRRREPQDA